MSVPEIGNKKFDRHSGQAGGSWRDPESRKAQETWIPACAGMTVNEAAASQSKFRHATLGMSL
jgi:hypothetical protein